ncbi:MAG: hypothetical protein ACI8QZ_001132 [Chlamydiales bacterium]|jgi:hypothetical protein
MSAEPILRLIDNPVGIAQARRSLRGGWAAQGLLTVGLVLAFGLIRASVSAADVISWTVARDACLAAIGAVLCLQGTARVSAATAHDRRNGLIDFHRTTPTSAWTDALGYVAGCALRGYVSALLLAPIFVLASLLAGGSLLHALTALYLVVATGLLCQVYGAFVGLASGRERAAAVALGSLSGLVVLASSAPALHLTALRHLTPLPALQSLGFLDLARSAAHSFTFFGIRCTPVTFTLLFQGYLLVYVSWATARRLRRERAPAFTRRGALVFFAIGTAFFLAPAWARLGQPESAAATTGLYLLLAVLGAGLLALSLVPSLLCGLREIRRARRLGCRTGWRSEGASSWTLVPCFALLIVAGLAMILGRAEAAGGALPGTMTSPEVAFALIGCSIAVSLLFGTVEYSRLVPNHRLLLIGFACLVLPWFLGTGASMLLSDSTLTRYLLATSPLHSLLDAVDALVRHMGGRPQVVDTGQWCWSLLVAGGSAVALWWAVLRARAGMVAEEAAAGDLPSIDGYRDASRARSGTIGA